MRVQAHQAFLVFAISSQLFGQGIRKFDFQKYLDTKYAHLCGSSMKRVEIQTIEFHDVDGDGAEEAIILAATCATGSGGPDIAEVFKLLPSGRIKPIFNSDVPSEFRGKKVFPPNGNWTQSISFQNGSLLITKSDRYGIEGEIRFFYHWKNGRFELFNVIKARPNQSSKRTPPHGGGSACFQS